jgi:hypothetical protein
MSHTVQLNASDALSDFEGNADKAHEVARRMSASCAPVFAHCGYSVMDENGKIEAIYRAGLRWKFRDADGLWVELPLFDAPETVIERSPVVEW